MKTPNYLLYPLRSLRPRRRRSPPGSSPGIIIGVPEALPPNVHIHAYQGEDCLEVTGVYPEIIDRIRRLRSEWPTVWVEVEAVDHAPTLQAVGELFDLHRLALEDVANGHQRAKVEDYGSVAFIVAKMAMMKDSQLDIEQLSLFLGPDFVVSFQERPGDPLEPVRARLRTQPQGKIRIGGPDYLAYAVLDASVDHYFPVLESLGDRLDVLEEEIVTSPRRETVNELYGIRRELAALRRSLWPMRDALNLLHREGHPRIQAETQLYLRDCYDHLIQNIELVESYRELTASLTDLYMSTVGHRTNEIMKVLTIFTAIFIPLSFIAGVYGMNFDPEASPWNMPELSWVYGYPFALGLMLTVALILIVWFRRRGWLGGDDHG